jgi:hypothetical protein
MSEWLISPWEFLYFAIAPLVAGILVACVFWKYSTKKRRAARLIDIASFVIALAGLASWPFSLAHQWNDAGNKVLRARIAAELAQLTFEARPTIKDACKDEHPVVAVAEECSRLTEYFAKLKLVDPYFTSGIPRFSLYSSDYRSDIHEFGRRVENKVSYMNSLIRKIERTTETRFDELRLLRRSMEFIAFAFGIGLARRAVDLYTDW